MRFKGDFPKVADLLAKAEEIKPPSVQQWKVMICAMAGMSFEEAEKAGAIRRKKPEKAHG